MNNSITLLLLTHNESENLKKNFKWLKKCHNINEIIVVDDNSQDNTLEIVKKLSSKYRKVNVFSRGLDNNFSAQRQFALSKASNNWILWLDPDEKPTSRFIQFLNHFHSGEHYNVAVKRKDIFLYHKLKHGETASQHFLRFFNKKYGVFSGQVHEVWKTTKPIFYSNYSITHQSHSTLKSFFTKIDFYSTLRADELFQQHHHTNLFEIIFYPLGKFIQNYFFRLGFLDGTPGIIFALGMSFHSFLVRSKLWQLSNT